MAPRVMHRQSECCSGRIRRKGRRCRTTGTTNPEPVIVATDEGMQINAQLKRLCNILISACAINQPVGRRMPGRAWEQRRAAVNPIRAVQERRGRRTWQRRRAATRGQARRRVEGCALALSVVGRDSAGRYPGLASAARSGLGHVPRVISPVLLRLGGLLRAVALGGDGAPQEESYAHDRTTTAFPQPESLNSRLREPTKASRVPHGNPASPRSGPPPQDSHGHNGRHALATQASGLCPPTRPMALQASTAAS